MGGGGDQICEEPGVIEEAKEDETRRREAAKKTKGTNQAAKVTRRPKRGAEPACGKTETSER